MGPTRLLPGRAACSPLPPCKFGSPSCISQGAEATRRAKTNFSSTAGSDWDTLYCRGRHFNSAATPSSHVQSDRAPAAPRGRLCVRHGVLLGSELCIFLFILIKGILFFIFFPLLVFIFLPPSPEAARMAWRALGSGLSQQRGPFPFCGLRCFPVIYLLIVVDVSKQSSQALRPRFAFRVDFAGGNSRRSTAEL